MVADGVVYIGSSDNNVYALNAATGPFEVDSSPAVVNGIVYFGSYDDNVYAFGLAGPQKKLRTRQP